MSIKADGHNVEDSMTEGLCIVHRDRLDLFEELCQQFKGLANVRVIFDRRVCERRRTREAVNKRRRGERRQYRTDVRLLGWILTHPNDAAIPLAGQ
jgi:hypothetical protein